jgi:hypothetical protein
MGERENSVPRDVLHVCESSSLGNHTQWEQAPAGVFLHTGPWTDEWPCPECGDAIFCQHNDHGGSGFRSEPDIMNDAFIGIKLCNVLYAKIDRVQCPGTVAEIGFAFATGKLVLLDLDAIAHNDKRELWFIVQISLRSLVAYIDRFQSYRRFMTHAAVGAQIIPAHLMPPATLDRWVALASSGRFQSVDAYVQYIQTMPKKYTEDRREG